MEKFIKIIIISSLILLFTGCSGNYNLTINEDLSVEEELDISISNDNNLYEKTLNIFETNNIDNDKYNVAKVDDKIRINYKDKFSSIEDYILNSKLYNQLFDNIKYNKNGDMISLSTKENLRLKNSNNILNGTNLNDLDVIQVNITNPFKVTNTNSDINDEKTYTWSIKNSDVEKEISMNFNTVLNAFPYRAVIVGSMIFIIVIVSGIRILIKYRKKQRF